jgi:hypothetical protein
VIRNGARITFQAKMPGTGYSLIEWFASVAIFPILSAAFLGEPEGRVTGPAGGDVGKALAPLGTANSVYLSSRVPGTWVRPARKL